MRGRIFLPLFLMELKSYNVSTHKSFKWKYLEQSFWNTPFSDSYHIWSVGDGLNIYRSSYDVSLMFKL